MAVSEATLEQCAVCGGRELRRWFDTDFGSLGRCEGCGQVLRTDRPSQTEQVRLHQTSDLHESAYAQLSEGAAQELEFFHRFLDCCRQSGQGRRVLDVGCGAGEFLKLAAREGFDAAGIEPTLELREMSQQGLPPGTVTAKPLEESSYEPGSFDAVAMWDIIEHLVDPASGLKRIHELLRPGGVLGVATINHDSLMYTIYHCLRRTVPPLARPFGAMLYNPFHTYYFTKESLARMVRDAGFEVVEHDGYEFPIGRLDVSRALKFGMRGLYVLQGLTRREGEQYLLARKV